MPESGQAQSEAQGGFGDGKRPPKKQVPILIPEIGRDTVSDMSVASIQTEREPRSYLRPGGVTIQSRYRMKRMARSPASSSVDLGLPSRRVPGGYDSPLQLLIRNPGSWALAS